MAESKFKTWKAYQIAFVLAREIFILSKDFPKEERYSLTDQIRRSSRSVCANLGEAFAKRRYPNHFIAKLTDCTGENYETQIWLNFALDAMYISPDIHEKLTKQSESVGKLLSYMQANPDQY
jgi:four helix bundle protein